MTLASKVTRALERQSIPVFGVSIGRADDRATWRVDFKQGVTDAQKTAAQTLITTYDEATDADASDEDANAAIDGNRMLKAVVVWTAQRLNVPIATARNQILAIYKTLN